jgi:hypothetical protein
MLLITLAKVLALWFVATGALGVLYGRRGIIATWREPVLRRPVLIIESDDWGAGPHQQAHALRKIAGVLARFSDSGMRRPVMTLGMVLATIDGKKSLSSGSYHRQLISRRTHGPLLDAIKDGVEAGVFSVQLHGMEHFWPASLMAASKADETVKLWLDRALESTTEELPSPLQTRWVDASQLPARRLDATAVQQAAREEVAAFQAVFGNMPFVAVPPTFVWNDDVVSAWAAAGVRVVMTPGRRYETRDENGALAGSGARIYNGQSGEGDIVYLVRDVYFEPSLGHTAIQAFDALLAKSRLARPALFETHRFNFLGTEHENNHALAELESLLQTAVEKLPDLAFLSSGKLAAKLKSRDPEWVELRLQRRLHIWLARLGELPRLRKLAWLTGWIVPASLLWRLTA